MCVFRRLLCAGGTGGCATRRLSSIITDDASASQAPRLEPRKVLAEDVVASNKHFRLEQLNQYDIDLVSRFGFEHIGLAQPLSRSLACESDDLEILFHDQCKRAVDSGGASVIAFNRAEDAESKPIRVFPEAPAGFALVTMETVGAERPPPAEFRIRGDYGDAIDVGGYLRRNANRAQILVGELQAQITHFLPPDAQRVAALECICVRPDNYRIGLAELLLAESIRQAKADGAEYMSAICLTGDLRTVVAKFHFRPYMDFTLASFRDRGDVVFKPVSKDPTSSKLSLLIAKL